MTRRLLPGVLALFTAAMAGAYGVRAPGPAEAGASPPAPAAPPSLEGPAYDGRFNFVRIRWEDRGGGFGRGRGGGGSFSCPGREPLWAHDMCRGAENYFATMLDELTYVEPHLEGRVLTLDDPELFRYPAAYIVEVGYWQPTDAETSALAAYLRKGGFLIVDDFRGPQELRNFEITMGQVLPGARFQPVEAGHRIWDSFFHIPDPLALAPPTYPQHVPMYLGVFENNDPAGRLMVILNFNNDIGEYWEWSTDGFIPIPLTNEAYKYGVNYVIYAMTH